MTDNETVFDRVREFLTKVDQNGYANISFETYAAEQDNGSVARLMWADVQMLLALAVANVQVDGNKQFLDSAERAVAGWKRANTNQIQTIARLQEHLRLQRIENAGLNRVNTEIQFERNKLKEEKATLLRQAEAASRTISEADEWQNEVAMEIPEEGWPYNTDGAQEGIILDYVKYAAKKIADQGKEIAEQDQTIVSLNETLDNYQNAAIERGMAD